MRLLNKALISPLALAISAMGSLTVTANEVVDGPVVLDVMAVYTKEIAKHNDMAAKLSQFVTYANKSYENSNINIELRLVHHSVLPDAEGFADNLTSPLLKKLKNNDYVAKLRADHGADFVSLIGPAAGFCGLGYVSRNNGVEGQLENNSKSWAYNLVDIRCLSSYAHELGHNMGLQHSRVQEAEEAKLKIEKTIEAKEKFFKNNPGKEFPEELDYYKQFQNNLDSKIFKWALGHGENGQFVTTMAYPNAYGVSQNSRLQYFSNPRIYECKGLACGVDVNKESSADAAQALNRLATQLAEFMPTTHPVSNVNNKKTQTTSNKPETTSNKKTTIQTTNTTTTNTTKTKVTTTTVVSNKTCQKTKVEGNLIKNGEFSNDQLQHWGASYASQLSIDSIAKSCGKDQVLKVDNSQYGAGAYTKITGVELNKPYDFSAKVKLATSENTRADAKVLLYVPGQRYIELKSQSVTDQEFTQLKAQFTIESSKTLQRVDSAYLFVYIPHSGTPFMLDEAVVKQAAEQPTTTKRKTSQVLVSNFENGLQSWHEGFRSTVALSRSAREGYYGLAVMNRQYWYSGAVYDVRGLLDNNQSYQVTANFKVTDTSAGQQYADMRLYYIDDSGHHWVTIKRQPVSAGQWHTLNGSINVSPKGKVKYQKLFLFGPQAGVNFAIDNVQIKR
ncbi:carbohydrate binding domain-containing protein [Spartinivicinus ruber]|uniref:carbohydrate binding domain-containing protein n=1 Tax=Spartinivicinus ruber TaxID=2683272 RepID=UPI0013D09F76|nr:carbohydrate binding domain-containing protein [Spartinivicinus ruber]